MWVLLCKFVLVACCELPFVILQENGDGEVLFQPATERPKVGEWCLVAVEGYEAGMPRVPEEEYNAEIEAELESVNFTVQDLAEEAGPEEGVGLNRFVNKLDPSQIGDDELSEKFIAAKAKPNAKPNPFELTHKMRTKCSSDDHADDTLVKNAHAECIGDKMFSSPSAAAQVASPLPARRDASSPVDPGVVRVKAHSDFYMG